jgi:hypothetical protein
MFVSRAESYSARLLSGPCNCRNVMPFVFDVKRAVAAHGVNMGCEHGDGFVDVCVVYLHSSSDY